MEDVLKNSWKDLLGQEFQKDYYQNLRQFLIGEYNTETIYPRAQDIYKALEHTAYEDVRVVIFGQDPYHGPNQAHGFSFSVGEGEKIPPSLRNIYKELEADLGYEIPNHGSLIKWADQGVLLLNSCLTVRRGRPNSHKGVGWEILTEKITELLNSRDEPIVFMLWGNYAREKKRLIDNPRHRIIESSHPSPFSAHKGFLGSKPFSRANRYLVEFGNQPIDWKIEDI